MVDDIQPVSAYLAVAQANIPLDHPWSEKTLVARQNLIDTIRKVGSGDQENISSQALIREAENLKKEYITVYSKFHRNLVLNAKDDDKRRKLYDDPRIKGFSSVTERLNFG